MSLVAIVTLASIRRQCSVISDGNSARLSAAAAAAIDRDAQIQIWNMVIWLKPHFHYGCALRCVAREIETLSASLYLSPRNATGSR